MKGHQGSAIYLSCSEIEAINFCETSIANSFFAYSNAVVSGGGIYYNLVPPKLTGNTFNSNNAESGYGNDIGSYPAYLGPFPAD